MRAAPIILALATTATAAHAQAVYTQAVQTTRGSISYWLGTGEPAGLTYSLAAPDPAASWSPPRQTLLLGTNQPSVPHSYLDVNWTSTVTPYRAALDVATHQSQTAGFAYTHVGYDHVFELRFSLARETPATFEAILYRQHYLYTAPIRVVLAQLGQAPIVDLTHQRPMFLLNPEPFVYNPTEHLLAPGDYVLRYTDSSSIGAHFSSSGIPQANDRVTFALNFIPAPGALPALLAGAALATRRRR